MRAKVNLTVIQRAIINKRLKEVREALLIKMAKASIGDTTLTPSMAKKIRTQLAKAKRITSQIGDSSRRVKPKSKPRRTRK